MTYGECKAAALNLIQQETIAGEAIEATYNNQADYLGKIPSLVQAAQLDLATTVKKIPASVTLGELESTVTGRAAVYTMPADMWQRRGSGLLVPTRHGYVRFNQVQMLGRDKIIVMDRLPAETIVEYYRYPTDLGANPGEDDLLDNVPEAQAAIPYYVGAHLVLYDDAFLYASLYNEYEAKKAAMRDLPTTEPSIVEDVYMPFTSEYNFWG